LWPNLFSIALWPLIGFGIWIMRAGLMQGRNKVEISLILAACIALILGPAAVVETAYRHYTAATVAADDSLFAALGVLTIRWDPRTRPTLYSSGRFGLSYRIRSIISSVMGAGLTLWSLWFLVGDFVLPRANIDGIVTGFAYETQVPNCHRSCVYDYYLKIDGRRYLTTYEIFDRFWDGRRLQGTVGRGSGRILSAEVAQP
jgi:hypothetical protein